jgi:hypothetical protein
MNDVNDSMTPVANQVLAWDGTKWTASTMSGNDTYLTKVGTAGTPDFLATDYFQQDESYNIRPKERINDNLTMSSMLWSSEKIAAELALKQANIDLAEENSFMDALIFG